VTGFDPEGIVAVDAAPFIGSFIGVLILRLPEDRPIAVSRSRCDRCGAVLGPADLAPLISYALLRGRCRHCAAPIGWFYPAVELAAVGVAVAAAALSPPGAVVWDCLFGWMLLALAWIDARTGLLPDRLTLPLILAGFAQAWFLGADIRASAIGAAAGYGFVWLIEIAYRRLRGRAGIGLGDAKLLAAAGAWLGWEALPLTVLGASVLALAVVAARMAQGRAMDRNTEIPFGPFLALAMWALRLLGPIDLGQLGDWQ
jgi:leader peptidase (prepilin peptidase)/N-methyltransferase